MIARLTVLVGICLVTSGSYSTCSFRSGSGGLFSGGSGDVEDQSFTSTLTLRDSNDVETTSFVLGEPIGFDFEIESGSSNTVEVQFDDAQIYDLIVVDAGTNNVRWQWSDGRTFGQVSTALTFDPGASRSFSFEWNGVLADGAQLPAGNYQARGVMVFDEFFTDPLATHEMGSPLVSFEVR